MRYFIGENHSKSEVKEYVDSIKDLSLDELFEEYIKNNRDLYHSGEIIYNLWRENYELFKKGEINEYIDPSFYTKENLMICTVADKFYVFSDDDILIKLVREALKGK